MELGHKTLLDIVLMAQGRPITYHMRNFPFKATNQEWWVLLSKLANANYWHKAHKVDRQSPKESDNEPRKRSETSEESSADAIGKAHKFEAGRRKRTKVRKGKDCRKVLQHHLSRMEDAPQIRRMVMWETH